MSLINIRLVWFMSISSFSRFHPLSLILSLRIGFGSNFSWFVIQESIMVLSLDEFKIVASRIIDGSVVQAGFVEAIKHLKKFWSKDNIYSLPKQSICPLSKKMMNNPVTLVSGEIWLLHSVFGLVFIT